MARFATLGRRSTGAPAFPSGFEAVGEALLSGQDPAQACAVVGRELAKDGVQVEEALTDLRGTWHLARGTDPSYGAVSAFVVAWTDSTLAYLHHLSCEDPMTGLANLAHVRGRVGELYLRADEVPDTWAVVVVELSVPRDRLSHSMRLVRAAQAVRTVFVRGETVGLAGTRRILAVVARDDRLGDRVGLLRRLLADSGPGVSAPRLWIEGLPANDRTAELLLDELAR